LVRIAAAGILNSLLAGIAIALLAWTVTRMFRREGSGTRFSVWFLGLVGIAVLPWFNTGLVHKSSGVAAGAVTLPESFALYVFLAWAIGAGLGLAHVAHGLYRLQRLRATCMPVDLDRLDESLRASVIAARAQRQVTLCTSDAVRVPAAIGYVRPIVVFPSWALAEIPPAELNAILLHELAHLRRYDDWTNLAQKIVKAVFFFHPAVWFIESRLTLEREMACDDAVLAANFSPRAYAESLVGLAERSVLRRGVQLAQAAVGHVRQLKTRLAEILRKDKDRQGSGRVWKPALALMSLVGMASMYGIARAPRMVAFTPETSQIASVTLDGNTDFLHASTQLRPVNLRYSGHAQPSTASIQKMLPVRQSVKHHFVPKPARLLAQNAAQFDGLDDDVPPPILALSSFPSDLVAGSAPMLVVFHSEQFGVNGPVVWQVTIFRLTPAQRRTLSGGSPKKI
jgi:bla regulator protein blaR1